MSDNLVKGLVEVVNDEIRLFNRLLDLLVTEQAALLDDDLEAIEGGLTEKRQVAEEATRLEIARRQAVAEVSCRLDMDPSDPSLGRIIAALDCGPGEELAGMRQTLLNLNQRIRQANESNAFLIRQSRRYTDRCLNILTGQADDRNRYGKSGRRRPAGAGQSLLNRMA
jgi:flagellar biosynthesis/type III secretory pathway chaperone